MATLKQKKLASKIVENMRKDKKAKPLKTLMKEVGYSDSQSTHPQQILKSKGFIKILEDAGVTDEKIAAKIQEGLDLRVTHANSPRFIDMSLKLKKHLNPLGEAGNEALGLLVRINLPPRDED